MLIKIGLDIFCLSRRTAIVNLPPHPPALHQHPPCPLFPVRFVHWKELVGGQSKRARWGRFPRALTMSLLRNDWIPLQRNRQDRISLGPAGPRPFSSGGSGNTGFCPICYDSSLPSPYLGSCEESLYSSLQSTQLQHVIHILNQHSPFCLG